MTWQEKNNGLSITLLNLTYLVNSYQYKLTKQIFLGKKGKKTFFGKDIRSKINF